jgi:signal transduction histidine kinase
MIFNRISYRLALQFTAFVFFLFLVNGAIFLMADIRHAHNEAAARLDRSLSTILSNLEAGPLNPHALPPWLPDRVRISDPLGRTVYAGRLFVGLPPSKGKGSVNVTIQDEEYAILTRPIMRNGNIIGTVEVADVERLPLPDLPMRVIIYLLASVSVSALTFLIGLSFSRRSLKPAVQMMERLEQFTQDASHELRTPLASLNSSLDLALKTKRYQAGIKEAKQDVKEITALIERMMELARLDKFVVERKPVDVIAVVRDVIETHQNIAQKNAVALHFIVDDTPRINGDGALIKQVLMNLVSNAIKFNVPQGSVTVRVGRYTLSVADTGIGVAKNDLAHIFDRFYQVDNARSDEGYGLGLALVKRIVDLHGFSIDVDSHKSKGTTFTVHFS